MKDLLPCPFCGSDNVKFFGTNGDSAYCRNCNAEGPSSLLRTIPDAIKEWNRRSDNTSHNKAMEQCAHEWLQQSKIVEWCPLCGCLKHKPPISGLSDVIIRPRTAP